MTNSEIFKAAHKLTKETIQNGDSYSATFGLCLSFVYTNGVEDKTEVKEYKLYIPFAEKKEQKRVKTYFNAKWNREGKFWMVNTSMQELEDCFLTCWLKAETPKASSSKKEDAARAFFTPDAMDYLYGDRSQPYK